MANFTPSTFTSLDGTGNDRAEVYVQTSKGKVDSIAEKPDKNVAQVKITVEHLKYPISGWIKMDSEAFAEITRAQQAGEEVTYRIESQRKGNVDRTIPIAELRKDAATAKDNTVSVLVGVNGLYTDEMVTNINEDPKGASWTGRQPAGNAPVERTPAATAQANTGGMALDSNTILENLYTASQSEHVRKPILDIMIAQALFAGVTSEEIMAKLGENPREDDSEAQNPPRTAFSFEAQPWKEYNSDGRLNLGNNIIAGAVGTESLIYKQISLITDGENRGTEAENVHEVASYFGELVFAITDSIQRTSYGNNPKADRSSMSHVRIRGVVYDVIERRAQLPLRLETDGNGVKTLKLDGGEPAVNAWITLVGKTSKERFITAVELSQKYRAFSEIVAPDSLFNEADKGTPRAKTNTGSTPAPEAEQPAEPAGPVESTPAVKPASGSKNSKIKDLQALADSVQPAEGETPIETKAARAKNKAATPVETDANDSNESEESEELPEDNVIADVVPVDLPVYTNMLEANDSRAVAGEAEIAEFKGLFSEYGYDLEDIAEQTRIVTLLKFTFGEEYGKASLIPAEELIAFVDFYAGSGSEALQAAMEKAHNASNKK